MEKRLRISYPAYKHEPRFKVYFPERREEETDLEKATLLAPEWARSEGIDAYHEVKKSRELRRHIEFEAMLYRV